jgi:hypothetical protein
MSALKRSFGCYCAVLFFVACCAFRPQPGHGAAVVQPPAADFDPSVPCPTPEITPGGTDLINNGVVQAKAMNAADQANIGGKLQAQFGAPWQYTWGANLGGTLTVTDYKAVDEHNGAKCLHGADFAATYSHAWDAGFQAAVQGDWTHLQWIQVAQLSHQAIADYGAGEWVVDPPAGVWIDYNGDKKKQDNEIQDSAPFYYNSWETHADLKWGPGGEPQWVELNFDDTPRFSHPEVDTWHGDVTFYLFLATWDGNFTPGANPHNVTIHDAFVWGWDGQCVPSPAAFAGGLMLMLGVAWVRRKPPAAV